VALRHHAALAAAAVLSLPLVMETLAKWLTISETSAAIDVSPT
jgi:hypothetical protein